MATIHEALAAASQHYQIGNLQAAEQIYWQILEADPDRAEAHLGMALLYGKLGRPDLAIAACQRAIQGKPDFAEAYLHLGMAWEATENLDRAISGYQRAIQLKPDYVQAHGYLGAAWVDSGHIDEGIACFQRALVLKPDSAKGHSNLGLAFMEQGNLEGAARCLDRAIELDPDLADAHWNRSMLRLLQGDFQRGWPEFEWRWRARDFHPHGFSQPQWDGRPLCGQTILLHAEQGLGDTMQFIRYAPLVKAQGGTVAVQCQPSLVPLLATCPGIDRLVPQGDPLPPFDVHASLLSLPGIFQTELETIPAETPYLQADPALVDSWRDRLPRFEGFRIGIAWQGVRHMRGDRLRSIPLAEFAPLAEVPGVCLISVQKGFGREQLAALQGRFPVAEAGEFDEYSAPDRAAILKNLDLLVTSDTGMAHLAGALGVPVWVALSFVPGWRWLLDREDSPWYPTMRLFRQTRLGDWPDVFQRIKAALLEHFSVSTQRSARVS